MTEKNHYVYRRRWATPRMETLRCDRPSSYDGDEEDGEQRPGACFKLEDRLLNRTRNKKVKNSIHKHPLLSYKILKEDKAVCTICEIDIIGLAYGCDQGCEFLIHKPCLHTPVTIKHWSESDHQLTLLDTSERGFVCDACYDIGFGYHYQRNPYLPDLHVACAGLPQTVKCNRHRYPLTLTFGDKIEGQTIDCSVCHNVIDLEGWIYYNEDSEFVAHLDCAFTEEIEESVLGIAERLLSFKVAT